MAIYLARGIRLDGLPEYEREKALIAREVRAIVDKVLEMGDGDVAVGTVRAFAAGVLDVPWSPNRHVKSRVMPARDADGYLRILEPGAVPLPKDVLEVHEAGLRARAARERVAFGRDLAVQSVYEIAEPLDRLLSDRASHPAAAAA
jgi:methylaspartate mutase epsilon subunit